MDVGVRELKQRLSSYVRRAAAGERIVVTDRGRPTAMLVPLPGGDQIAHGLEQGWISEAKAPGPPPPAPRRYPATTSVQAMVDEDRNDP